jgi:hypothetical protein
MPRKRLTQTLLTTKTVPELVVLGFTPNDIAGAATKILSNKGSPGRRKHLPGNAISLWLAVELKRAFKGHKIKPASDFVAANVRKRCPGVIITGERIRKLHREVEKRRAEDSNFAIFTSNLLAKCRGSIAKLGTKDFVVVPLRLVETKGGEPFQAPDMHGFTLLYNLPKDRNLGGN